VLPEFRDPGAVAFDLAGAALSLLALLAVVYGIKRVAEGGDVREAAAAMLLGILLGAAFVSRQRRAARPMIDPGLFRGHAVRIALVSNTLMFFALYGTEVAVAQYLQWVLGLPPLAAGLWTIPSVLAYLGSTALAPAAAARFPRVRIIKAGLVVAAAGAALLAVGGLAGIVAGTVVFAVGLGPVYNLSTELIMADTRPQQAGVAGAVGETSAELGGALGIALLGSLGVAVSRHAAFEQGFTAIGIAASLIVVAALAAVTLMRPSAEPGPGRGAEELRSWTAKS
jgi:DHA2 family multidrug resistance protein-like MFS transporter